MYNDADIFVNPTYADTFPTTNLEALACGTPVITYRTGGSPESITPETGIVVEQGNISAIVQAIEEISSKGKKYYTDACRKYAEANFDKERCFAKYINLYTEILNKNK
jgi:glycosyltransferase involved in cell wall biosynthesis